VQEERTSKSLNKSIEVARKAELKAAEIVK
jgi:hypothetical protein